jgi:hypothetical protein
MDDREMLELAAKAAGFTVHGWINDRFIVNFGDGMRGEWNPLTDDGDCARLQAALQIDNYWDAYQVQMQHIYIRSDEIHKHTAQYKDHGGDRLAAWRAAVVAVAIAIGKEGK